MVLDPVCLSALRRCSDDVRHIDHAKMRSTGVHDHASAEAQVAREAADESG